MTVSLRQVGSESFLLRLFGSHIQRNELLLRLFTNLFEFWLLRDWFLLVGKVINFSIVCNDAIGGASFDLPDVPVAAFGIGLTVGRVLDLLGRLLPLFVLQVLDETLKLGHVYLTHVVRHFDGDRVGTVALDGAKQLHLRDLSPRDVVVKKHLALGLSHALVFLEDSVVVGSDVLDLLLDVSSSVQVEPIADDLLSKTVSDRAKLQLLVLLDQL